MIHFNILIIAGLLVAVVPHLGFPQTWNTTFLTITGFAISALSYYLSRLFVEDENVESKDVPVIPQ